MAKEFASDMIAQHRQEINDIGSTSLSHIQGAIRAIERSSSKEELEILIKGLAKDGDMIAMNKKYISIIGVITILVALGFSFYAVQKYLEDLGTIHRAQEVQDTYDILKADVDKEQGTDNED